MPTRSAHLASSIPAAGVATTVLTVPAGQTYLVKSVLVGNTGGANDTVQVFAVDATGARGYIFNTQPVAVGARADWEGWVALNPGDSILVISTLGTSHFWFSGTKLPGIA